MNKVIYLDVCGQLIGDEKLAEVLIHGLLGAF